jgi:hypothetical protein
MIDHIDKETNKKHVSAILNAETPEAQAAIIDDLIVNFLGKEVEVTVGLVSDGRSYFKGFFNSGLRCGKVMANNNQTEAESLVRKAVLYVVLIDGFIPDSPEKRVLKDVFLENMANSEEHNKKTDNKSSFLDMPPKPLLRRGKRISSAGWAHSSRSKVARPDNNS